jgi:hypothetical protein
MRRQGKRCRYGTSARAPTPINRSQPVAIPKEDRVPLSAMRFLRVRSGDRDAVCLSGLHPEKTRVLEFGRFAAANRAKRGQGKPQTLNFLGFTHISGCDRRGKWLLRRITRRDRMVATLKRIKEEPAAALAAEWLPPARILHPWPNQRFDATHPRQVPGNKSLPPRDRKELFLRNSSGQTLIDLISID